MHQEFKKRTIAFRRISESVLQCAQLATTASTTMTMKYWSHSTCCRVTAAMVRVSAERQHPTPANKASSPAFSRCGCTQRLPSDVRVSGRCLNLNVLVVSGCSIRQNLLLNLQNCQLTFVFKLLITVFLAVAYAGNERERTNSVLKINNLIALFFSVRVSGKL